MLISMMIPMVVLVVIISIIIEIKTTNGDNDLNNADIKDTDGYGRTIIIQC